MDNVIVPEPAEPDRMTPYQAAATLWSAIMTASVHGATHDEIVNTIRTVLTDVRDGGLILLSDPGTIEQNEGS